jgi:hypothetical protein
MTFSALVDCGVAGTENGLVSEPTGSSPNCASILATDTVPITGWTGTVPSVGDSYDWTFIMDLISPHPPATNILPSSGLIEA